MFIALKNNSVSNLFMFNIALCYYRVTVVKRLPVQYNLNGSFTVDDSNFFSPYKILPIAQENKYLGFFSYFIMELYVVCTHSNRLIEAILMSTLNIQSFCRKSKRFP